MPIKPKPRTYVCPSCGWQKSVFPVSDAMMPGDYFKSCPKSGTKELKQIEPTMIERLTNGVLTRMHRKWG